MTIWRLTLFLLLGLLTCETLKAQNQGLDSKGRPTWISTPKAESNLNEDIVSRSVREARSSIFNSHSVQAPRLDDLSSPSGNEVTGGVHEYSRIDPLPVDYGDAIVVGSAISFQPYFSGDHTRIYSELVFRAQDIIKDSSNQINPQSIITLLQEGGTIQLADGRTVTSSPFGGSNPVKLDTRYLLFLRYAPQMQAYTVIRAWDLSGQLPVELDNDGHPYHGIPSKHGNLDAESISSEDSLIALVKSRVTQK